MAPFGLLGFGYGNQRAFPRYRQAPQGTGCKSLFQGYWKNNKVFFDFLGLVYRYPHCFITLSPISTFGFIL